MPKRKFSIAVEIQTTKEAEDPANDLTVEILQHWVNDTFQPLTDMKVITLEKLEVSEISEGEIVKE